MRERHSFLSPIVAISLLLFFVLFLIHSKSFISKMNKMLKLNFRYFFTFSLDSVCLLFGVFTCIWTFLKSKLHFFHRLQTKNKYYQIHRTFWTSLKCQMYWVGRPNRWDGVPKLTYNYWNRKRLTTNSISLTGMVYICISFSNFHLLLLCVFAYGSTAFWSMI